jgi:hypothetical protein
MKKMIIAFVLTLAALSAATSAFAQNGVIKDFTGTVELKTANSTVFVAAKVGDAVSQDTVVSTAFKSTAIIEIGSAVIAVRPLTRMTLTEIRASSESESLNVSLQSGRIRVDVKPPAGTKAIMTATSPTSTASVRGTSFELDARNLHVISGNVAFKGTRGAFTVITTGFDGTVGQNGSAVNPLVLGDSAYRPRMPVGTQSNAKPTAIANGTTDAPDQSGGGDFGIGVDY